MKSTIWMAIALLAILTAGLVGWRATEDDPVKYYWRQLGPEYIDSIELFRVNTRTGKCWRYKIRVDGIGITELDFSGWVHRITFYSRKHGPEYDDDGSARIENISPP